MKLPESWVEVRLDEICLLNPKLASDERPGNDTKVTFVPMSAVDESAGVIAKPEVRTYSEVAKGYTGFKEHDVLFAKVTPCMENGKAAIAGPLLNGLGFGSTEFHVLRPTDVVLPEYLFHFIRQPAFRARAASAFVGTGGLQRVPPNFMARVKLPLPTLLEQQRIIDLLGEAQRLRDLRRSADITSNRIKQALFLEMFGDPASNPKRLRKAAIGKLIKFKSGVFLPAKDMAADGSFKVYGGNGVNGFHDQYMFEERKIVLGRVGAYCGAVHYSEPKAWITDNALYVSERLEYLDDHYLVAALELANLNRYAGQAGQPLISASRINPVEILVPDEADQKKFSKLVIALLELGGHCDKAEKQLGGLWKELIQQAFTGQLTETWREQHRAEIEAAAIERDTLMRERGAKLSIRTEVFAPPERPADFSRPARYWLLNELSEFQGFVLDAIDEWPRTLLADNASDLDKFSRLRPVEYERNMHDRAKRALEQLAALGLIAKVALANDNGDFVTGYRRLRAEEKSRLNDIAVLQASIESASHDAGTTS